MSDEELRVSTLELFFDLVFVFTITQLTAVLVHHPDAEALAQVVLMLTVIWWMYGAFAWLTNAVPPDRTALRLPLLGGMLAFFAISLTIPTAFTEDGVVFACAYLVVIAVHTVLYMQSASWTVTGVWSFARMNIVAGALILVGAIIGGAAEYVLWGVAVTLFVIVPALVPDEAGWIRPDHFVERHGLVIIIALGESVVAVGIGASGIDVSWEMLAVATLGLMLSAELWWVYFMGDDDEAEEALRAMGPTRREFYATNVAYYWAHLLMLLGIVCIAAGLERAIGHAFDELSFARSLELGGGTALFLRGTPCSARYSASPSSRGAPSRWSWRWRRSPWVRRRRPSLSWPCWSPRSASVSRRRASRRRRPPAGARRPCCVRRTWPRRAPRRPRRRRGCSRSRRPGRRRSRRSSW